MKYIAAICTFTTRCQHAVAASCPLPALRSVSAPSPSASQSQLDPQSPPCQTWYCSHRRRRPRRTTLPQPPGCGHSWPGVTCPTEPLGRCLRSPRAILSTVQHAQRPRRRVENAGLGRIGQASWNASSCVKSILNSLITAMETSGQQCITLQLMELQKY